MNERWHIPRPSLSGSSSGGGSSNSSSKSHSNPSTVNRNSRYLRQEGLVNYGYVSAYDIYSNQDVSRYPRGSYDIPELHASGSNNNSNSNSSSSYKHSQKSNQNNGTLPARTTTATNSSSNRRDRLNPGRKPTAVGSNSGDKRGSRSSRGSTDSNSSSHSGTSESLLLTAANLERFTAIHKNDHLQTANSLVRQNYNANITTADHNNKQQQSIATDNPDTIIAIDPNLQFVKTKDVDSVSIASSTHFTMVNGVGRPPCKPRSGLCSRSHQITVLILTMSTFFLIGILLAIYLLEMRARSMPR